MCGLLYLPFVLPINTITAFGMSLCWSQVCNTIRAFQMFYIPSFVIYMSFTQPLPCLLSRVIFLSSFTSDFLLLHLLWVSGNIYSLMLVLRKYIPNCYFLPLLFLDVYANPHAKAARLVPKPLGSCGHLIYLWVLCR